MTLIHKFDLLTTLHVMNIITIMILIFYLVWFVADKRHSLFWGVYWYIITLGKYKEGLQWYFNNPIYIAYRMLIAALLLINITLIGQLIDSEIFERPVYLLLLSPCVWALVLWVSYLNNKKIVDK